MKKITRKFLNLLKVFTKTLTDFKYYKTLDKLTRGKAILYIILISLLFSIIAVIPSAVAVNSSMKEFYDLYEANAPDFVIAEGKLTLPQPGPVYMIDDDGKAFVVVFDDSDILTELDFREYESVLLLDSDSVYLRSPVGNQEFPYTVIFPDGMDKQNFSTYMGLIKLTNIIFIGLYILLFILFNLLGAFFISAIGNLMMSFKRKSLNFTRSFALACYASTLPILLKTITHVFSLNIRYFDAIYVLIGVLYFWNAANAIMKEANPPATE
ncbi:MAG: DUF1189 family protein [Clostridiales bacterium]|nr:DUF1189 family protein [Clostridiales bacterium]